MKLIEKLMLEQNRDGFEARAEAILYFTTVRDWRGWRG